MSRRLATPTLFSPMHVTARARDTEANRMRREKAFLRNGLIIVATIIFLIVVTILLARTIAS